MSDNHDGIYICLIILIILVAGVLAVLIYNSDIRLPEPQKVEYVLTPEQKDALGSLGWGILAVIIGSVIIGIISALLTFRASNVTDKKVEGQ